MKIAITCAIMLTLAAASVAWAKDDTPDFSKPDKPAAREGDRPGAKRDADKPGAKTNGDKPGAKAEAKGKDAPVVFDPPPPMPDEAAIAKARKTKRPYYTKFAEAKDAAWKCQQPLVVALLPQGNDRAKVLESKVLKDKLFAKDFVSDNCVLLLWRLKPGKVEAPEGGRQRGRNAQPPKATTIDTRALKPQETKFLTAFVVTPQVKANAKRANAADPKFSEMKHYPCGFCVDPSCSKLLFYIPKYEAAQERAGLGAWLSQMVDLLRAAKVEPAVTPALQKVIDNPTEPKKWK